MRRSRAIVGVVTFACCLAALPARAQSVVARTRGARLTGSTYGGYDAPLFATNSFAALQPKGQTFGGVDGNLDYARPGRRVSVGLVASASTRYFPQFTPSTQPSYGAGLNIASASRGKWTWSLNNFAYYAPIGATSLFATSSIGAGQAATLSSGSVFQVSTIRQVDTNSAASIEYSPSRRMHFQLMGGAGSLVPIDAKIPDNLRLTGRARISRDITRNFRGYIGYAVNQNRVSAFQGAPASSYQIDGFDFGVDFGRPFRITRNTTLGIQTGIVKVPEQGRKTYQLTGSLALDHTFLRTWNAQVALTRDARFVQSFKDPVVFAGGSASAGGRIVGDLGATLAANYSHGTINTPTVASGFTTYSSSLQFRYDLRRLLGMFIEYSAFRSDVDAASALIGYPTGTFGRQSVRAGLSLGLSPFSK